jgi:hypothetical protein
MGDFGLKAGFMPDFPYLAMSGIVLSCWENHILLLEGSCCSVKRSYSPVGRVVLSR